MAKRWWPLIWSERGTARHAVLLGILVTISHTLGVFLLGLIALFASRYIVPSACIRC